MPFPVKASRAVGDCLDMSPLMPCPDSRERHSLLWMRSLCRVKGNILVRNASAVLLTGVLIFAMGAAPAQAQTWVSGVSATPSGTGASITWSTAVPADSQVEYGASASSYGAFSALSTAKVTSHSITLTGLAAGTTYHFRVRSSDANGVVVIGPDYVLVQPAAIAITVNPPSLNFGTTAVKACSAVQITTVTNNGKSPVTVGPFVLTGTSVGDFVWGGVGTCSSGQALAPGLSCTHSFKFCPTAAGDRTGADSITTSTSSSPTVVTLSGTGSVSAPALAVSPASLSFAGQTGSSSITPSSVSITNTGTGSLTFTGVSDQPWLVLSANSGTAPSTLQVSVATTSLKAGTYSGHVTLTGGGVTKTLAVALTLTSPPVQHSVALSWKASTDPKVVSYSVYRSSISGSSYALSASAIGGVNFSDQSVLAASTYYYVVTAVDDQGRESEYSPQVSAIIP